MFEPIEGPRLFGMPPGADFPVFLVEGLLAMISGRPPEDMARVTIYLNTARMQRRVRSIFDQHGARLLPRIRLITDLGRDPAQRIAPAIPPLRRRLELARLVASLMEKEPDFGAGIAVYELADSLARLIDEMHGEGVNPCAFEAPDLAENHSRHWEQSLRFIRIVARYFDAASPPDAEARQRLVVEALADCWRDSPPNDPIVVAGSTGSRGATLAFMRAVARLPQGAVILPGVDFDMPVSAWTSLLASTVPGEDHPQFRFLRLVESLGVTPGDIAVWPGAKAFDPARNRVVSLALRPAPVTDQWMNEGANLGDLCAATADISLIEADSPREEAQAIAARLRFAAETGQIATLVTPDRTLARRVAAALDRWGIVPDDSAGLPLIQSAPGRLLRHVAGLIGQPVTTENLLILLKHPLTATGADNRGNHLRFARDLELHLRRYGPAFPEGADLLRWAQRRGAGERIAWAHWLSKVLTHLADAPEHALSALLETHIRICELLAAGPDGTPDASGLWREEAGRRVRAVLTSLEAEANHAGDLGPPEYSDLIASLLNEESVRRSETVHTGIMIWGTLEARVQGADLVILAGLNEGVWPEAPAPDPWLSRQMRLKVGLLLPERRVGLAAHDFQQAIAAPEVVLSRAIRDAEAETVPSRWLARLTNLLSGLPGQMGPEALAAMRATGRDWCALAGTIEAPQPAHRAAPAIRPSPRPPVKARPKELPVTDIQTLIRDPYAIYAKRILSLRPLDPLRAVPDARLRGKILHEIVEDFIRDRPDDEGEEAAHSRLLRIAEAKLVADIPWPSMQRIWLARIGRIARSFVQSEQRRQDEGRPLLIEEKGSISLEKTDLKLTARPDRIDVLEDGSVRIFDYKSGKPPSAGEQAHFNKQLLLEAAMAERGAFTALGRVRVSGTAYIQLGGDADVVSGVDTDGIYDQTWTDLHRLIQSYERRETGYTSRRAMFEDRRQADYDHLARYGEWSLGDKPEPEDVG